MSYSETFSSFKPTVPFPTMRIIDTLEATCLPMEVNELKIDSQTNLRQQCGNHWSIYLFCERSLAIRIDIEAHCRSIFGWGTLHWIANNHFPAGSRKSITVPTNAKYRPKVGDIAAIIHNKCLEGYCIYNGRCACRYWV